MKSKLQIFLTYFTTLAITLVSLGAMAGMGAACHKSEVAATILLIFIMIAGLFALFFSGIGCFLRFKKYRKGILPSIMTLISIVTVAVGGGLLGFGIAGTLFYQNLNVKEFQSISDVANGYDPSIDAIHVLDYKVVPNAVGYYMQVVVSYNKKTGVDVDRYHHFALPLVGADWDKQSSIPAVAVKTLGYKAQGSDLQQKVVPESDNGYFIVLHKGVTKDNYRNPIEDLESKVPIDQKNVMVLTSRDIPTQTQVKKNALFAGLIISTILLSIHLVVMITHVIIVVCRRKSHDNGYHAVSQM